MPTAPVAMNAYVPGAVAALRPATRSAMGTFPGWFSSSVSPRTSAFSFVSAATSLTRWRANSVALFAPRQSWFASGPQTGPALASVVK